MISATVSPPFFQFLREHREAILSTCKQRTLQVSASRPISHELELGWGIFFDELVLLLEREHMPGLADSQQVSHEVEAAKHGKEYLRLGYSISEVVHSYGVICQAMTGQAELWDFRLSSREFRQLNLSLDVAIAEAVSSYEMLRSLNARDGEVERLGFLTHELRSSLYSATLALSIIREGTLGLESQTGGVLERSLERMKQLIDATVSEVRARRQHDVHLRRFNLAQILGEVVDELQLSAAEQKITLSLTMDKKLLVNADRQLLLSALQNLVQNAIKFSRPDTAVCVSATISNGLITIAVEDRCGGLKTSKPDRLFAPFSQYNQDRSGLGLGLAISRRAVELNGGKLEVDDLPGKGCIFRVILPKAESLALPQLESRPG